MPETGGKAAETASGGLPAAPIPSRGLQKALRGELFYPPRAETT